MRIIYHVKVVCRSFHRCPHSTACATNFQNVWWRQRHIANALASVLEAVITHRTVTKATYKKKNNILMVFNTTDKKYIFHLCGWAVPASLCVCVSGAATNDTGAGITLFPEPSHQPSQHNYSQSSHPLWPEHSTCVAYADTVSSHNPHQLTLARFKMRTIDCLWITIIPFHLCTYAVHSPVNISMSRLSWLTTQHAWWIFPWMSRGTVVTYHSRWQNWLDS